MKRTVFFTILGLFTLGFTAQAFAVAQTAGVDALANTERIENDCSTENNPNPNVVYRCQLEAQQAEIEAEEQRQENIQTALAAAGAAGAFLNMRGSRGNNSSGSSGSTGSSVRAGGSSPDTAGSVDGDTTAGSSSEHTCSSPLSTGCHVGSNAIKIDVASSCMCIGPNCFDFEIVGIENPGEALAAGARNLSSVATSTGEFAFSPESDANASVGLYREDQTGENQRGIRYPEAAFPYLEAALENAGADSSPRMDVCSSGVVEVAAAGRDVRRPAVTPSPDTVIAGQRNLASPASSKLTRRMNHAVRVRNQFAPVLDNDSVD